MSDHVYRDRELQALLETLDPNARDAFRWVLIHDQADRDAIASQLLRTAIGEPTTAPTSSTC